MAITISGQNNNDKILASDGVLDSISGFNGVGVLTATTFETTAFNANHINVGSTIQLGNAGIITATTLIGNVTGNVNSTSNLLLQISGSEKFRVGNGGQLGIGGANYGTSGQVLTSGGSGSAPTWTTISTPDSDKIEEGNTKAEVIDTGSNGYFYVSTEGIERFRITSTGMVGIGTNNIDSPLEVVGTGPSLVTIHHGDGGTNDEARIMLGALPNNPPDNRGAGIAAVNNGAGHDLTIKCSTNHSLGPTEKVRIKSDGRVLIGTTTPSSNAAAYLSLIHI